MPCTLKDGTRAHGRAISRTDASADVRADALWRLCVVHACAAHSLCHQDPLVQHVRNWPWVPVVTEECTAGFYRSIFDIRESLCTIFLENRDVPESYFFKSKGNPVFFPSQKKGCPKKIQRLRRMGSGVSRTVSSNVNVFASCENSIKLTLKFILTGRAHQPSHAKYR